MIERKNISVLLVDSECAVCNKSVQFIQNHLGKHVMIFRSLYSEEGKRYLKKYGFPENYDQSLVFIDKGRAYIKSEAVLRIARKMRGLYPLFSLFFIIPRVIRDYFYDLVSSHRHRLM